MRGPCLAIITSLFLGVFVHGQTTITLENGTSVIASQLRESGDSLRTEKGCFAKRDILHVVNGKNTYVYNVISNGLAEVRFEETCRTCRLGRIYGTKYVSSVRQGTVSRIRPGQKAEIVASGIPSAASMTYDSKRNRLVIPMNDWNAITIVDLNAPVR